MKKKTLSIFIMMILLISSIVPVFASSNTILTNYSSQSYGDDGETGLSYVAYEKLLKEYKIKPKGVVIVHMKYNYNKKLNIYIVGGEKVITKDFENAAKKIKGVTVKRFAGKNRFETNKKTLSVFNLAKNKGITVKSKGSVWDYDNEGTKILKFITQENSIKNPVYFRLTNGKVANQHYTNAIANVKYSSSIKNLIKVDGTGGITFEEAVIGYSFAKCLNQVKNGKNNTVLVYEENYKYEKNKSFNKAEHIYMGYLTSPLSYTSTKPIIPKK